MVVLDYGVRDKNASSVTYLHGPQVCDALALSSGLPKLEGPPIFPVCIELCGHIEVLKIPR